MLGCAPMTESLTVLSHSHALATKRFYLGPNGKPLVDDYGKGKRFQAHIVQVADFLTLAEWLESLLGEPCAFVIRGEPIPGRDLSEIYRRCKPKDGEPPGFREVPRQWLMIDADQALTREDVADLDFSKPEHCEEGVKRILAQFPAELRQASCFWQLSSSAGFKPGLRAHLWFWLDRPMGERELTRWAENVNDAAGRRLVDPSVFRTVQPNYTANPILDVGVTDPVGKRWGIIDGTDVLVLPRMAERAANYLKKLEALRNPRTAETHPHIRDACASYFCARGPDAPETELVENLRRAVQIAHSLRGSGDTIYTDEKLAEYVANGREFATSRSLVAENLARNNDGTLKPTLENARAIVTASPEWDGVMAKNARADRIVALVNPPFEAGYAGPVEACPRPWRDTDDRRLVTWLARKHALNISTQVVREAVDVIAAENTFEPIRDYLLGLAWDEVPRLDTMFVDLCGVADSRYARKVAAMWMIQGVARALEPGCKADGVLVLEGAQGKRKSTFLRDLAGGLDYFQEGIGDIYQKDTLLSMQTAWIIEIREMAGLSGREIEAVKAFLDRQNDRYRSPYGARPEDHPRRCILAATTNLQSYLRDDTGARRWWPLLVTTCDLEGLGEVRDQLWAEAVHRYRAGEVWHVESDDPDFVKEQEARFDEDSREEILRNALNTGCSKFRNPNDAEHPMPPIPPVCSRVTVAQVLYHHWQMPTKDHDKRSQMAVSSMLRRLKWERKNVGGDRFWVRGGTVAPQVVDLKKREIID